MEYKIYIHNSNDKFGFILEDSEENLLKYGFASTIENSYVKTYIKIISDCIENLPQHSLVSVISPIMNSMLGKKSKLLKALRDDSFHVEFAFNSCFTNHPKASIAKKFAMGINPTFKPQSKELINPDFIAYTDGSCNNLSPFREGGAAFVIVEGSNENNIVASHSKCILGTTNNRAELLAILSAVRYVPERSTLIIRTDSQYCIDVLTNENNAGRISITNGDIITQFFREKSKLKNIKIEWVKGHNGNYYNEMADSLAESRREEVRELYRIPVYTYKNRNEPNPRVAKFYNWFETSEDAVKYKDTLPF